MPHANHRPQRPQGAARRIARSAEKERGARKTHQAITHKTGACLPRVDAARGLPSGPAGRPAPRFPLPHAAVLRVER
eukprot:COSAG01_NODE_878_length_12950_cov_16.832853_2_plen_77_part_00